MCELMGLSFARPISAAFSFREFAVRGEENADGWGLAWYPDRALAVVKEPLCWGETPYTTFLEQYPGLRSSLYVAHVRHKTVGGKPTHADTHPFARELNGHEYCFVHNGTLRGRIWELPLSRFRPIGVTDSERAFCYLLGEIARRNEPLTREQDWRWLQQQLVQLNEFGQLNCLLADGQRLFCYHDQVGYKGLMFRTIYLHDGESDDFEDAEWKLHLVESRVNSGFVVATHPLNAAPWQRFEHGELLVLEKGMVRFSSHRDPRDAAFLSSVSNAGS